MKKEDKKNNLKHDEEVILDSLGEIDMDTDAEFEDLDVEGEELSTRDKLKKLNEKIRLLTKEKQEYLSGWQRAQADYANREKEIAKEKSEYGRYAVKNFIEDLLPVLDTYDAARSNKSVWESVDQNWRAGIEYIFSTFETTLAREGVEGFGAVGDKYDPEKHEALEKTDTEDKSLDGTIDKVIMRGYTYNNKGYSSVIRPAKVKVFTYLQ